MRISWSSVLALAGFIGLMIAFPATASDRSISWWGIGAAVAWLVGCYAWLFGYFRRLRAEALQQSAEEKRLRDERMKTRTHCPGCGNKYGNDNLCMPSACQEEE